MGFYAPAQLLRQARAQGVDVLSVDVVHSLRESSLEPDGEGMPSIRLGLRQIKGLSSAAAERLVAARAQAAFTDVQDLAGRAGLERGDLGSLAAAGALKSLARNRHRARWDVAGLETALPLLAETRIAEGIPLLRRPTEGEDIVADYASISLGRHPLALLRRRLDAMRLMTAAAVAATRHEQRVRTAGLVITRQRPASAAGVTFVTLEDETGYLNLIVWESLAKRQRRALVGARLLGVEGKVQREGEVLHIVAERLFDHSALLGGLVTESRDFQ
jgi:error-prone DNA polymerase